MGKTVLADAQYGVVRILRPFAGFETTYGGTQAMGNPIALTQGGLPLDPLAGQPGYSPVLLRGLSVPIGAKILLWIPMIEAVISAVGVPYIYSVAWRYRSIFDYRQNRGPWHYAKQAPGVPDTTAPPGTQARVVKPAAWETVDYLQTEPMAGDNALTDMHALNFVPVPSVLNAPLVPGGTRGVIQQGVFDPAISAVRANSPLYLRQEIRARGDEMLISVYRPATAPSAAWDFTNPTGADFVFSQFYGSGTGRTFPDIGVLVAVGTSV